MSTPLVSRGDLMCMPILFMNLSGEMIYILEQRFEAQRIPADKAMRVLADVASAMFSVSFLSELFKPQEIVSSQVVRAMFDRLAHSSIMRLNRSSMNNLFDLMTMGFKQQLLEASTPAAILSMTLVHMQAILRAVNGASSSSFSAAAGGGAASPISAASKAANREAEEILSSAIRCLIEAYAPLPLYELWSLRQSLFRFLEGKKVRISLLLSKKLQLHDGSLLLQPQAGQATALPRGTEPCGRIRYWNPTVTSNGARLESSAVPLIAAAVEKIETREGGAGGSSSPPTSSLSAESNHKTLTPTSSFHSSSGGSGGGAHHYKALAAASASSIMSRKLSMKEMVAKETSAGSSNSSINSANSAAAVTSSNMKPMIPASSSSSSLSSSSSSSGGDGVLYPELTSLGLVGLDSLPALHARAHAHDTLASNVAVNTTNSSSSSSGTGASILSPASSSRHAGTTSFSSSSGTSAHHLATVYNKPWHTDEDRDPLTPFHSNTNLDGVLGGNMYKGTEKPTETAATEASPTEKPAKSVEAPDSDADIDDDPQAPSASEDKRELLPAASASGSKAQGATMGLNLLALLINAGHSKAGEKGDDDALIKLSIFDEVVDDDGEGQSILAGKKGCSAATKSHNAAAITFSAADRTEALRALLASTGMDDAKDAASTLASSSTSVAANSNSSSGSSSSKEHDGKEDDDDGNGDDLLAMMDSIS